MNRKFRIRLATVVLAALIGTIATVAAGWRPSLGLDLQGGTSVVLEPKGDVKPDVLDRTISIIRSRVDALGVAEPDISRQGDRSIVVSLPGVKDSAAALDIVGKTAQLTFRPVLQDVPSEVDFKAQQAAAKSPKKATTANGSTTKIVTVGGSSTTVAPAAGATPPTKAGTATTATPTTSKPAAPATATTATAAKSAADTTQALGLAGPGRNRYSILNQAATTVAPSTVAPTAPTAATATTVPGGSPSASTTIAGAGTTVAATTASSTKTVATPPASAPTATDSFPTTLDTTKIGADSPEMTVILPGKRNDPTSPRYLLGPAEIKGAVVDTATARIDTNTSDWTVDLQLNSIGSPQWDAMASKYFGQRIAIVLDGEVVSAPSINARKFDGQATISGAFTSSEAKGLATALKFGSLPVTLVPQTVQNVSASLGKDSLRAGLVTGLIGLLLVACYMIFYYRSLGLVVVSGLLVSGGLMWSLVSFLSEKQGLALSLSGVVGIIVSFGTTVDSYVVFFERMRDEQRAGRNVAQAVDRGFKSAFRTIIAADFTSLIGAGVLYFLTVGSVRGFALFLIISTSLDLLVAWAFTRPIVTLIAERQMKRQGLSTGSSSGPTRITPAAGRLKPGSATTGVQL